jgi:MFS family permease
MPEAHEPRPSPEQQRTDLLLWTAVLLSPLAMAINTIVGYTVAHWANDIASKRSSYLVSIVDFLVAIGALLLSLTLNRQLPEADESQPEAGRRRFMARIGMLLAAMTLLLIFAQTLAVISLRPSD